MNKAVKTVRTIIGGGISMWALGVEILAIGAVTATNAVYEVGKKIAGTSKNKEETP